MSLHLTPPQRRAWTTELETTPPTGGWIAIAKELTPGRRAPNSWQTKLSNFKRGLVSGLKPVFGDQKALEAVARHLDRTPEDLRTLLARVQGESVPDAPEQGRLPGFEDFGARAILEVYFPARCVQVQSSLVKDDEATASPGATIGNVRIDPKNVAAECRLPGRSPRALVLVGPPGVGRSATLRAIAAHLELEGVEVSWRGDTTGDVVLCDDIDSIRPGQRADLVDHVIEAQKTMVVATVATDPCRDLPSERAVYTLAPGDLDWASDFVDHLETRVATLAPRRVDLASIRSWLVEDPFAVELAARADVLGAIARASFDREPTPTGLQNILGYFLRRAEQRLRGAGRTNDTLFIHDAADRALAELANARNGRRLTVDRALRALETCDVSETEARSRLAALVDGGLLWLDEDCVEFRPPVLRAAALGVGLARVAEARPLEESDVEDLIMDGDLNVALAAAAQIVEDLAPVLAVFEALSPALACHALPAMTRVLATDVRCSDTGLFERLFLRATAWWLRWPIERSMTRTSISMSPTVAAPATREDRVGGMLPFVVLGLASARHADHISRTIEWSEVQADDALGPHLHAYLELRGIPRSDRETKARLLVIAAPAWSDELESKAVWAAYAETWQNPTPLPFDALDPNDLTHWWRFAAAPMLERTASGTRLLSGCGAVPISTFLRSHRGTEIWGRHLEQRIAAQDPRVVEVFATAVVFALEYGPSQVLEQLQTIWERSRINKTACAKGIVEMLRERSPRIAGGSAFDWVASTLGDELVRLWIAWSEANPTPPWQAFLRVGLSAEQIATWACEVVDRATSSLAEVDRVVRSPDSAADSALEQLCADASLEALQIIASVGIEPWSTRAASQLRLHVDPQARRIRIDLAAEAPRLSRQLLLQGIRPTVGESTLWASLVDRSETIVEFWGRIVELACAERTVEAWETAAEATRELEAILRDPATVLDAEHGAPFERYGRIVRTRDVREWIAETQQELFVRIAQLGPALLDATETETMRASVLFESIFVAPHVRAQVGGYFAGGHFLHFWLATARCLGFRRVREALVDDVSLEGRTVQRLEALWRLQIGEALDFPLIELLDDQDLGVAMGRVVGAGGHASSLAELERRPLGVRGAPDEVTLALATEALRFHPEEVVSTLERRLAKLAKKLRAAWWRALLPELGPGGVRLRTTALYFEATHIRAPSR